MADTNKFLDYGGLQTLWGIITRKFAQKSEAVGSISIAKKSDGTTWGIGVNAVDGTGLTGFDLPLASSTQPGLMTAEQFNTIDTLSADIDAAVPLKSIALKNGSTIKKLELVDTQATIELKYEKEGENAYIALVDASSTAADKAISKIDVTELLKTGMLQSGDIVTSNGKTCLKLVFNTLNNGVAGVDEVLIEVTDLLEQYTAGEGISITQSGTDLSDDKIATTISLNAATDSTLGGIKTGYSESGRKYAVKLDSNKAYVLVPWDSYTLTVAPTSGENLVSITNNSSLNQTGTDNSKTHNYLYEIGATQKLKDAVGLAETSAQSISSSNSTYLSVTPTDLGGKGKSYAIGLNTTDSLTTGTLTNKLPNATAVKDYVDTVKSNLETAIGTNISTAIQSLDSDVEAGKTGDAKNVFTKIDIVDGKLNKQGCTVASLVLSDITDFAALTTDDIEAICQ